MIELIGVNKNIGKNKKTAFQLKNINLTLNSGDNFLLLGKNGSGKSTLMKIISGIILVDTGKILFNDKPIEKITRRFYKKIGFFQSAKNTLDVSLNIKHNFEFTGYMYKCKKAEIEKSLEYFINEFPILKKLLYKHFREVSLGERTICELVNSLIHLPEYIFLDEPTIGIDNENKKLIADFILSYSQLQTLENLIISTHDFDFAKNLNCNKAGVMGNGSFLLLTDKLNEAIEYAKI